MAAVSAAASTPDSRGICRSLVSCRRPFHHQVRNETDEPVRVLMLSTLIAPEIVEYPDSGKIGARSATGERILLGRPGPNLDYWDGED